MSGDRICPYCKDVLDVGSDAPGFLKPLRRHGKPDEDVCLDELGSYDSLIPDLSSRVNFRLITASQVSNVFDCRRHWEFLTGI